MEGWEETKRRSKEGESSLRVRGGLGIEFTFETVAGVFSTGAWRVGYRFRTFKYHPQSSPHMRGGLDDVPMSIR